MPTIEDKEKTFGIDPARIYRKYCKETQKILGLGRSAIEDAIKNGDIPPAMPLTAHGYATGWLGCVLIEVQRRRLALAAERHAAAAAGEAPSSPRRGRRRR